MAFETTPIRTVVEPKPQSDPGPDTGIGSGTEPRSFDYDSIFNNEPESDVADIVEEQKQPDSISQLTEQMSQMANLIAQMQQQQAGLLRAQQSFDTALTTPLPQEEKEEDIDEYNMPSVIKKQKEEVRQLKDQLSTLQEYVKQFQYKTETTKAQEVQAGIENAVRAVDKELSQQGYEGFASDGRYFIHRTIEQLVAQGKQQQANELYHSPDKWGEVWKRKVDRDVQRALEKRDNSTNKQQIKSQGQLITTPGSNRSDNNEDEDTVNVWANYARIRGIE